MAFVLSLLALQTLLTVCLFFAVSKMYARVVELDQMVTRQRSQAVAPPVLREPRRVPLAELPVRTRVAAEASGATAILVVAAGCASCEGSLAALAESPDRRRTLVVSGQETLLDDRLRSIIDDELTRLLASEGATLPVTLQLERNETAPTTGPADELAPTSSPVP